MSKLKPIGYIAFARKLKHAGYMPVRKSKHTIYFHPAKQITIPFPHKHSRDIPTGLLRKLIKEMGISVDEFNRL
jgi:predicted RNA binding protein YcfA (HicA-like mRNA interferase family)